MFLTNRQKEVLDAQAPRQRSQMIAKDRLGIAESTISSINHVIFNDFVEALELMADPDYFHLFDRGFRKRYDRIFGLTRKIRTNMKQLRDR